MKLAEEYIHPELKMKRVRLTLKWSCDVNTAHTENWKPENLETRNSQVSIGGRVSTQSLLERWSSHVTPDTRLTKRNPIQEHHLTKPYILFPDEMSSSPMWRPARRWWRSWVLAWTKWGISSSQIWWSQNNSTHSCSLRPPVKRWLPLRSSVWASLFMEKKKKQKR